MYEFLCSVITVYEICESGDERVRLVSFVWV